jgi:hypothetical protein
MARPLAALERFFEMIFERPAARLFRTRLQPVQVQRRLERAMEAERRLAADRIYVPNRYRVRLSPEDAAAFAGYQATLQNELADALLRRARVRGYSFIEHPTVTIHDDPSVARGDIGVEAELLDPLLLRPAPAGFRRVDAEEGEAVAAEGDGPRRTDVTAVFEVPKPRAPQVSILVRGGDGAVQRFVSSGAVIRVGRASDNDIVLVDDRASRHHGQLSARQGTLVYVDLGSTNGSFVNGHPVTEIALGTGDVVQIGSSMLTIEPMV